MVFSSVSSFLDPPNWPLQTNSNQLQQQQESGSVVNGHEVLSHQLPPLPQNPSYNPTSHHHVTALAGRAPGRPGGSMAERARLEKMPQPETPLNCPRCHSINTKFCYYNNYSLSQPRYFCKGCRRYWTQGGTLRNVPVGGGCRRNKKGKTGNSKSSPSSNSQNRQTVTVAPTPTTIQLTQTNNQFPFLPTLQNLSQLGNIGLNLAAMNANNQAHVGSSLMNDLGFLHAGTGANTSVHDNHMASNQFAFFDPMTGLYAFQNEGNIGNNVGLSSSSASMTSAAAPVKMEEPNMVNMSRTVSGLTSLANHSDQYWFRSGFSGSSSNDHLL